MSEDCVDIDRPSGFIYTSLNFSCVWNSSHHPNQSQDGDAAGDAVAVPRIGISVVYSFHQPLRHQFGSDRPPVCAHAAVLGCGKRLGLHVALRDRTEEQKAKTSAEAKILKREDKLFSVKVISQQDLRFAREEDLDEERNKVSEAHSEVELLQTEVSSLTSALEEAKEAQTKVDLLQKETQELTSEVSFYKAALAEEKSSVKEANWGNRLCWICSVESQRTVNVLETQTQGLKDQVPSLTSALEEDRRSLEETQSEVQRMEKETLQLKEDLSSLISALEEAMEAQSKVDLLQKETQELRSEVSLFKAALAEEKSSVKEAKGKQQVLLKETHELRKEVSSLTSALEEERNKVMEAQSQGDAAAAVCKTLSDKLESEEKRRTLLEQKIEELSLSLTSSQETSSTLRQENNLLQQTMATMEQQRQEELLQKKNRKRRWFLCGSEGASSQ
uniref:Uncharacterized protein n=1 Tax=Knipowitschia caucasica TaxID=637954 RepID=A0AAV2IZE1_KNICA